MSAISLLVVGNELIPRRGIERLLSSIAGFEVKGDIDSEHAVEYASELMPDVVIVLAAAAKPTCAQLVASLGKALPHVAMVILGRETHHSYVGLLLASGALGYVLAGAAPEELFGAIRDASCGRKHIDRDLSDGLFELLSREARCGTKALSQREQEVIRMLAHGFTLKEISSQLHISTKSIETYRARSQEKLGLRTRADIVRYALHAGMLDIDLDRAC